MTAMKMKMLAAATVLTVLVLPAVGDAQTGGAAGRASNQPIAFGADSGEQTAETIALRGRAEVLQWLFWQMGGLGPMAGQNHHFVQYAPERIPYAVDRYVNETNRLYGVLDRRLEDRPFIAGEAYSIADMASYPWIVPHERQGQNLAEFPNLKRWFETIRARPATIRAYERGQAYQRRDATVDEEAKKILFGQTAASLRR